MKYLIASKGGGCSDFTWTNSGEPVLLGFVCDNGCDCGCSRCFTGIETRKATTVAEVSDTLLTVEQIARRDAEGFWGSERWCAMPEAAQRKYVAGATEELEALFVVVANYPLGTQLRVRIINEGAFELMPVE